MAAERSDRDLMAAVADRDRGALQELHARHAPWITSRLRRRWADADVVADAVQDTFVAAWRGAGTWDGRGEPAAWLWGVAIRRLIGVVRSRQRWAPTVSRFGGELRVEDEAVTEAAEEQVLLGIEHGELAAALRDLSPELRSVVRATVLDGLTTREAGRLLGIPPGTVKTRMMRAKAELREALA